MKIAIVHDFLLQRGGAEKVVEVLHEMFPSAPIYALAYDSEAMPAQYREWDIRTSFLQKFVLRGYRQRLALPLYPMAIESFDLREYDIVVSSSYAFAKGVVTQPDTIHLSYTHTPMRFAWMYHDYIENERLPSWVRPCLPSVLHYLRNWDYASAQRVDHFIANSGMVANRIRKFYRRDCQVIFPPVDTCRFAITPTVDTYYVVVSRLVPYKKLDLVVEAFNRLKLPLKIAGQGRQMAELKAKAGKTVEFLGYVSDAELPQLIARAKGYVLPGVEDFCIAQVEANACGRPVIGYAAGGVLDTQIDGVTGVLFHEQSVSELCDAVCRAESIAFDTEVIQQNALRFDTTVFRQEMMRAIAGALPDVALPNLASAVTREDLARHERTASNI